MEERDRVVLGGLLHDIGKFYMRTGLPAEDFGREEWREEHGSSGAHARWSASFFSRYVPGAWREAGWLALTHHAARSDDPLGQLVQRADRLAAGLDREARPAGELGDVRRDRLESPLERIALPRQGAALRPPTRRFAHALLPLALRREVAFPSADWDSRDLQGEYRRLWEGFAAQAARLRDAHAGHAHTFDAYVTSLLALLERYTWCVPGATYRDYPSIPLFDHLKATAAVAACLHAAGGEARFLFIEADLGGIQPFLYESASPSQTQEGTAQRLRGKSFFLDLAMRTLAERLRRDLGLPACNLLWCSGGHFALLAPDTAEARGRVEAFRDLAERWCWEEWLGDISLALVALPAGEPELRDVGALFAEVGRALGQQKQRRFQTKLADENFWAIRLKNEVCRGCGRDVWKETESAADGENGGAVKMCQRCRTSKTTADACRGRTASPSCLIAATRRESRASRLSVLPGGCCEPRTRCPKTACSSCPWEDSRTRTWRRCRRRSVRRRDMP